MFQTLGTLLANDRSIRHQRMQRCAINEGQFAEGDFPRPPIYLGEARPIILYRTKHQIGCCCPATDFRTKTCCNPLVASEQHTGIFSSIQFPCYNMTECYQFDGVCEPAQNAWINGSWDIFGGLGVTSCGGCDIGPQDPKLKDLQCSDITKITTVDLEPTFFQGQLSNLTDEESLGSSSLFGRSVLLGTKIQEPPWISLDELVFRVAPALTP